jgi:hypothetical protein
MFAILAHIFFKHNVGCFDVTTNNAKEVHFLMKIENAMIKPHISFFELTNPCCGPICPLFLGKKSEWPKFKNDNLLKTLRCIYYYLVER